MLIDKKTLETIILNNMTSMADEQLDDTLWKYYYSNERERIETRFEEMLFETHGVEEDLIQQYREDDELFWEFLENDYIDFQVKQLEKTFKEIEGMV